MSLKFLFVAGLHIFVQKSITDEKYEEQKSYENN